MRIPNASAARPSPPPASLTTNVFFAAVDRTRQSRTSTNISEVIHPVSVIVSQRAASSRRYKTNIEPSHRMATDTSAARIFRYVFISWSIPRSSIVILHRITPRIPAKAERDDDGERREEEHEECVLREAGFRDARNHCLVAHGRIDQQHPEVADRHRQVPERHDHAFHREWRLAVRELEPRRRYQHFTERQ